MKKLNKYTSLLVSAMIAVALTPSAVQASGKVHVNFVPSVIIPSVIIPVGGHHHANNLSGNQKNSYLNKRNNYYNKNIYKTNYRAHSNYNDKVIFTKKVVNTKRPFNQNSKKIIRIHR